MAIDHAHALTLPEGEGVVRFYRWVRPTLSLGRNELAAGRWRTGRLTAEGVDVVRRPTGGRAVLHDAELTYAVVVAAGGPGSMRALYDRVNRALVAGLRSLGVAATRAAGGGAAARPDAGPCFARPADGEVVVGGRKLVGSAQVRLEGRLLQHGSILLDEGQHRVATLLAEPSLPPVEGVTSLAEWLDEVPPIERLVAVLTDALAEELGGDWPAADTGLTLSAPLLDRLETLYGSPAWTWRR